jgi:hypothetical protein
MLERHLTRVDVEQYVLGALDPEASAKLEAHTLVCDPCAGLLQQEALLEEQLREVAASAPSETRAPVPRPARWRRVAATVVGPALATAAAVGVLVLKAPAPVRPTASVAVATVEALPLDVPRVVACPDMSTQESCASAAAERGLMVQYPMGVGEVPRYEGYAGLPAGAISARGPSPL